MAGEFPWRQLVPDESAAGGRDPEPGRAAAGASAEESTGGATEAPASGEDYRALLEMASHVLDRVDHALGQLADGTYGRCKRCGTPIDAETLAGDPTAQHCAEHS